MNQLNNFEFLYLKIIKYFSKDIIKHQEFFPLELFIFSEQNFIV
jgi:hypothetical protein